MDDDDHDKQYVSNYDEEYFSDGEEYLDETDVDLVESKSLSDPDRFRLHFFRILAALSSTDGTPTSTAQSYINRVLHLGSNLTSVAPSSEEETQLTFAFISACTDVRPYLRYLPPILPWKNVGHIVDRMVLSEDPYKGDFCWAPFTGAKFLRRIMREGFIPIADCIVESSSSSSSSSLHPKRLTRQRLPVQASTSVHTPSSIKKNQDRKFFHRERIVVLLPKLNSRRCILTPSEIHISRNVRKRSNRFTMTVNQSFDAVVEGCIEQHGESWLFPPVSNAIREIVEHNETVPAGFSIEVYFENCLVAGELGVVNGTCYTSYTGFASMDSSGSVQLAALGRLLQHRGIEIWDLGMHMRYKEALGGHCIDRKDFVSRFRDARDKPSVDLSIRTPICCRFIIDGIEGPL